MMVGEVGEKKEQARHFVVCEMEEEGEGGDRGKTMHYNGSICIGAWNRGIGEQRVNPRNLDIIAISLFVDIWIVKKYLPSKP